MVTKKTTLALVIVVLLAVGALWVGPLVAQRAAPRSAATMAALEGRTPAEQLSQLFRAVAKAVSPAVVEVRVTGTAEEAQPEALENLPPELRRFFRGLPQPGLRIGLGSGTVVDAEKGYVLTNYHVIEGADEVLIVQNGHEKKAEWIRSDPKTDLAVVKVDPNGLTAAELGDSDAMEVGDWVLAIGSPAGLEQTVTAGIISGKGRRTARGAERGLYESFLQTDAAINRGNSGGPLVNMEGKVIGVNTAIVTPGGVGQNAGIGLSIPSNLIKQIMAQLIEKGRVTRGYLGISFSDTEQGLQVRAVLGDSPADQGGMRVGDIILAVDGQKMEDSDALRFLVANMEVDSEHKFTVRRRGQEKELTVTIGEQPEDMRQAFGLPGGEEEEPARPQGAESAGLRVTNLTPELARQHGLRADAAGVVITDVQSPTALAAGLRPGLLITSVNDEPVRNTQEFRDAMRTADLDEGVAIRVEGPAGSSRSILLVQPEERTPQRPRPRQRP